MFLLCLLRVALYLLFMLYCPLYWLSDLLPTTATPWLRRVPKRVQDQVRRADLLHGGRSVSIFAHRSHQCVERLSFHINQFLHAIDKFFKYLAIIGV